MNLGSRVQGATKHLKCRLLIAGTTAANLDDSFARRRLCRVRVVNIAAPVDIFEVQPFDAAHAELFLRSTKALDALEANDFAASAALAGELLKEHKSDRPLRLTLSRTAAALTGGQSSISPVWEPPGK